MPAERACKSHGPGGRPHLTGDLSGHRWLAGDFNGDGKDDLVEIYGEGSPAKAVIRTHFSTDARFADQSTRDVMAGFWSTQKWVAGDFDGDGMDDLANIHGTGSPVKANIWVHRSTGQGFEYKSSLEVMSGFWDSQRWVAGDLNGDGKDDLLNIYTGGSPTRTALWAHLSKGAGFDYQSFYRRFDGEVKDGHWLAGDLDGDGQVDLTALRGTGWAE